MKLSEMKKKVRLIQGSSTAQHFRIRESLMEILEYLEERDKTDQDKNVDKEEDKK